MLACPVASGLDREAGGEVEAAHTQADAQANVLVVEVRGLRNDKGYAMAALYDRAEGFPSDRHAACRWGKVRVEDRPVQIRFADLAPGTYAVGLIHDENGNGHMDRNAIGIPKEGFGLSGYDEIALAFPKFARASFEFRGGEQSVGVRVHYMSK